MTNEETEGDQAIEENRKRARSGQNPVRRADPNGNASLRRRRAGGPAMERAWTHGKMLVLS